MARIMVKNGSLEVRLTLLERLGGLHGSITIPLSAVRDARVVDQPFRELRGHRSPGTGFPGQIALGTWRRRGGKDFVAVYWRQRAILVDLTGTDFDRLLIGTSDPEAMLRRLKGVARY